MTKNYAEIVTTKVLHQRRSYVVWTYKDKLIKENSHIFAIFIYKAILHLLFECCESKNKLLNTYYTIDDFMAEPNV